MTGFPAPPARQATDLPGKPGAASGTATGVRPIAPDQLHKIFGTAPPPGAPADPVISVPTLTRGPSPRFPAAGRACDTALVAALRRLGPSISATAIAVALTALALFVIPLLVAAL
jgi:hypothetical protein